MDIKTSKNGNEFIVAPEGEINILTAPELEAAIGGGIADADLLTLDFAGCDYVSSAGLRVLLATFKTMKAKGAEMRLINIGENFAEVLQNTGLDAVFGIE